MSRKLKCPYCFEEFDDDKVLFRLEDESVFERITEQYRRHKKMVSESGEDKAFPLEAFVSDRDQTLISWWKDENNVPVSKGGRINSTPPYQQPLLDPSSEAVRPYLRASDTGDILHREKGYVDCIQLGSEVSPQNILVRQRACPHCHNHLPDGYGKYPTDIIAVIGITSSGKTVYLSTLLSHLNRSLPKWSLSSYDTKSSLDFIRTNPVSRGNFLPASTTYDMPQAPIYYEIDVDDQHRGRYRKGLLIYDIAGENFDPDNMAEIENHAKYIRAADGIILLLDPLQFENIARANEQDQSSLAISALTAIQNLITGDNESQVDKPIAVCLSKSDAEPVQQLFNNYHDLQGKLGQDPEFRRDEEDGEYLNSFVADDYNVISKAIMGVIQEQDENLHDQLRRTYSNFNYFAVTALGGCELEKVEENGHELGERLTSDAQPRRIIEPLLWLFSQFGYLRVDGKLHSPTRNRCPKCDSINRRKEKSEVVVKEGFLAKFDHHLPENSFLKKRFGKEKKETKYYCHNCGNRW